MVLLGLGLVIMLLAFLLECVFEVDADLRWMYKVAWGLMIFGLLSPLLFGSLFALL